MFEIKRGQAQQKKWPGSINFWRGRIAHVLILAAALFAAWQNLDQIWKAAALRRFFRDTPAEWALRIAPIKEALPDRGVVGYISDRDLNGADYFDTFQETLEFIWSQYTLAPVILTHGADQPLVMGILSQPLSEAQQEQLGLQLVQDFGFRIYLFERLLP